MTERKVTRIITAHRQREGGGFIVRRPFPTHNLDMMDPFLLLDEMGPIDYEPGKAVGAPDHPHRGFETVTYILSGSMQHKDSAGHSGALTPGDVQWMTAGEGIVHSEMPSEQIMKKGGRVHGFQVWVNLPRDKKLMKPRYQERKAADIPKAVSKDGLAHVAVVAGRALGVQASIATVTPIIYQHWTLQPGSNVRQEIPSDFEGGVYVFEGSLNVGETKLADGQLGLVGPGDSIELSVPEGSEKPAQMLLLAGRAIKEPVARHGPFVMNSEGEIRQAIIDYQMGKMGTIRAGQQ